MLPVAIFRFSPTEGSGHFGNWLARRDIPSRLIALDRGDPVPVDPRLFAGIGMMGGPMSVNDNFEWNAPLLQLLREAIGAEVPVVGHCLGGQMLAKALDARVRPTTTPEIGWGDVTVAEDAAHDWFGGRLSFTTFQWHYDVFDLPAGATRVLQNQFNPQQAYVLGRHIGFQCHIEMTRAMVDTWCASGADELPATTNGAMQSRNDILLGVDAKLAALSAVADDVYARWAQGLAR